MAPCRSSVVFLACEQLHSIYGEWSEPRDARASGEAATGVSYRVRLSRDFSRLLQMEGYSFPASSKGFYKAKPGERTREKREWGVMGTSAERVWWRMGRKNGQRREAPSSLILMDALGLWFVSDICESTYTLRLPGRYSILNKLTQLNELK